MCIICRSVPIVLNDTIRYKGRCRGLGRWKYLLVKITFYFNFVVNGGGHCLNSPLYLPLIIHLPYLSTVFFINVNVFFGIYVGTRH